jgi:hypothetical protein
MVCSSTKREEADE